MSTAIAANITEVPASGVCLLTGVTILDQINDLVNIQSKVAGGQIVEMVAEFTWGVQCLQQKHVYQSLSMSLYEVLPVSLFLLWVN
jgi:hypothetical protein